MEGVPTSVLLSLPAKIPEFLLKFVLKLRGFVQDGALGRLGHLVSSAKSSICPSSKTALLTAEAFALSHVSIVHLLEFVDHLTDAVVVLVLGVNVEED